MSQADSSGPASGQARRGEESVSARSAKRARTSASPVLAVAASPPPPRAAAAAAAAVKSRRRRQTPRLLSTISTANSSCVIVAAVRDAVSSATHSATSLAIASDL